MQPLVGRWNFDYLAKHFGSTLRLNVHFAPCDTTVFSRHYGKGLGKGGCTPMTFQEFVRRARADHLEHSPSAPMPSLRYYLQSLMVWNDSPKDVHGQLISSAHETNDAPNRKPLSRLNFGEVIERDVSALGWDWLKTAYTTAGENSFDTCQLWVGHGGGATPLHFDSISNFLAQVAGRKQVVLFPPGQTFHVYPYPIAHPMDNFAMIDVEQPDKERFPALRRAKALEAVLEPGDVLWLPRFYWHYVHQLDAPSENISLNFCVSWDMASNGLVRSSSRLRPDPHPIYTHPQTHKIVLLCASPLMLLLAGIRGWGKGHAAFHAPHAYSAVSRVRRGGAGSY